MRRFCYVERGATVCKLHLPLSLSRSLTYLEGKCIASWQTVLPHSWCTATRNKGGNNVSLTLWHGARYENKNEQRAGSEHVQQCFYLRVLIFSYFFIQFSSSSAFFFF